LTAAIEELSKIDQWVAFSRVTKIPVAPNGVAASSMDQDTWGTLAQAKWVCQVQGLGGVGFMLSEDDPFVVIDLDDALNSDGSMKVWARAIVDRFDGTYCEISPGGYGLHIWLRGMLPRAGARVCVDVEGNVCPVSDPMLDGKIEIYASRRYMTVTGLPVDGSGDAILSFDLDPFWKRWFHVDVTHASTVDVDWEAPPIESWLAEALACIPSHDYWDWVKIGMALKAELGEAGFDWWDRWSSSYSGYSQAECVAKWRSFSSDGGVNIGSLIWIATEMYGFVMPKGGVVNPITADWDAWIAEEISGSMETLVSPVDSPWVDVVDCWEDKSPYAPDLISPGVLSSGDIMLLFGPPKSMKTFWLMDALRAFSAGRSYMGMGVDKPLKVAYANFEVKADEWRKRLHLADMDQEERDAMRGNFKFTDRFTPVLNADFVLSFASGVLASFGKGELDVLVIDPIANIYTGDNENDNAQMSKFLRQIKALRDAIDPSVALVLVHHANKSSREDRVREPFNAARGASSLRGAYDAGIYVDQLQDSCAERRRIGVWFELRNGPGFDPMQLTLVNGRFVSDISDDYFEADPELAADEIGVRALADLESRDDVAIQIERVLCEEALEGRLYVERTFAERFAGEVLGGVAKIRRELKRLVTIRRLGYFSSVYGVDLEPPHHRSQGYLCCRGMLWCDVTDGVVHDVLPDKLRTESGVLEEVMEW